MSSSMLDEPKVPDAPKMWVCPCCVFSFTDRLLFIVHLEKTIARCDAAIIEARKAAKK